MTAPLPRRKQLAVLRMYFEGLSYNQIAHHAGVAKGSVEEVVRRLKSGEYEEFQDVHDIVETLRDIAVMVRKDFSGDLERCHVGSMAWVSLNRLGVNPAKVPEWARMCEDIATSEVPAPKFAEIAIWSWRLQKELGIPLLELTQYLESLAEKVKSSLAEREAVESQVQAARASLAPLREELGLRQDIEGLQSSRKQVESRLVEAQSRTGAALAAAEITSEGLEQFRVFAGTAKAKGVPVDGALLETLLALVGSLRPQGIREVETLRNLLAKEGISAAEGAPLLTGLWRLGFTLSRAADVARAVGNEGAFPDALARLVSLLHEYGTLQAAADASKQRLDQLSKQETAQVAESEKLNRHLAYLRNEVSNLQGQVKEAGEQRERIRAEAERSVAEGEAQQKKGAEEVRRLEDMREAWFDEYGDRLSADDYVLLGTCMRKKNSLAQVPTMARWVWGLMTPQGSLLTRPRLAAGGTPVRGSDGAVIDETGVVTLSRLERLRLRELLQRASLEGEGPLHAVGRITSGPPGAPPQKTNGSTDEESDLLLESILRNQAVLDLLRMIKGICEGRIGHFKVLPGGRPASAAIETASRETDAGTLAPGRGEALPEGARPAPKAPVDLRVSGIMSLDDIVHAALSPKDATPNEPTGPRGRAPVEPAPGEEPVTGRVGPLPRDRDPAGRTWVDAVRGLRRAPPSGPAPRANAYRSQPMVGLKGPRGGSLPAQMPAAGRPTTREGPERPPLTSSARRRSRLPSKGSTQRAVKKTSTGEKRRGTSPNVGKSRNTTTRRTIRS